MTMVDLYLRLSVDREGKDSLERQETDLRAWAKREKLTVRKVWRDQGKSGYKKDVVREEFDAAIRAVSTGEVGTLAVWKLDRLSRRGAGQVGLVLDAVEEAGGRVHFLRDSLDSTVPGHRMVIVMVSEQARAESANTSMRVRAKIASDAAHGVPKGGLRAFGYETDGVTIRPHEGDLIRDAVTDYLAGTRSMLRIAKDWTEKGILTDGMSRQRKGRDGVVRPALKRWTATTVRQVLQRDRNAGILTHNGTTMPESKIQPIVTVEDFEALKFRVKVGTRVGARAKSLLGGVIRCECGAPMHSTTSYSKRKGGPRYVYRHYKCSQLLYDRTRRHASISEPMADALLTSFILLDLYKGELSSPQSDKPAALQSVTERLTANSESFAHVSSILMDVALKTLHPTAKGELKVLDAQRAELESERDALLSLIDESGDLALFLDEWREDTRGFENTEELEQWTIRFEEVWGAVGIERKQSLIKARYRPTVRIGGRGVGRISPNPVKPSSFGQPIESDDEDN